MEITGGIREAYQKLRTEQDKKITLKEGQVVYGTIIKQEDNKTALVQIGQLKLTAQVDTYLHENGQYWFEVHGNNEQLKLKVIDLFNEAKETSTNHHDQLLKQLQLPLTKENEELLSMFLKEGISFTKEMFVSANALLKNAPSPKQGVEIIKWMLERQLPFDKAMFDAILKAQQPGVLTDQLERLNQMLRDDHLTTDAAVKLFRLQQLLEGKTTSKQEMATLIEAVKIAWKDGNPMQSEAQSLLEKIGMTQKQIQSIQEMLVQQKPLEDIQTFISKEFSKDGSLQLAKLDHHIHETILHGTKDPLMQHLGGVLKSSFKDVTAESLKQSIEMLGLDFERDLLQFAEQPTGQKRIELMKQLKPLLLQVKEQTSLAPVQTMVDDIVQKITGQQLLNVHQQPLAQLFLQFPLMLGTSMKEVTMKFEGKKKDGQIDPDYCRILFYLQLDALKETVLDVSIQEKIVGVNVYNQQSIKPLIQQFSPLLKEKLASLGYKLSYVQAVEKTEEQKVNPQKIKPSLSYHEVDIRI